MRRCQESDSVLCIQGPFIEKTHAGLCFHCMPGFFCEQVNACSVLSAFQIKVTNGVLWDLWLKYMPIGLKNAFVSRLRMGFPISVVVFLLHPAFTCESIWLPILVLKAVAKSWLWRRVSFFNTVLFITAVLHSGANVLYIQMKWVTLVWACLDFYFVKFSSFFFFSF